MCTPPIDHLIISPHLDDGILSLGAAAGAWRRLGERVLVATVFTAGPQGPLSPAASEDQARYPSDPTALRLAEDSEASKRLDVQAVHLGFGEVLFRNRPDGRPRCTGLDDIFGPVSPADDSGVIGSIAAALMELIERTRPVVVYLPLGIGTHIDHAIVRRAGESLDSGRSTYYEDLYYEDLPYALDPDLRMTDRRGRPRLVPPDSEAVSGPALTELDIQAWLNAVGAYRTQVEIMFPGRDWRSEFRSWADQGNATRLWSGPR